MLELNKIYQGDCLEVMKEIDDKSVNMILCDLPYGTTACKWDTIIPFESLWEQYKRIIKDNGAIVLTASQPFTSALVMSNVKDFKYCWTWDKVNRVSGFLNAKKQPLRNIEDIAVFYTNQQTYNPQMGEGKPFSTTHGVGKTGRGSENYGSQVETKTINNGSRYPTLLLKIKADNRGEEGRLHPTQKPVALFEYLIKTYTNEGDLVLDNCAGSGTTGVACQNLKRNFILIEKEPEYVAIAENRLKQHPLL